MDSAHAFWAWQKRAWECRQENCRLGTAADFSARCSSKALSLQCCTHINKPCLISRHYIANTRWTAFGTCRSRCISMDCVKPAGGARLDWHSPGGLHSFSCWYTLDVPLHPSHVGAALLKQAELSRWMNSRENSLALRKLFCMGSY